MENSKQLATRSLKQIEDECFRLRQKLAGKLVYNTMDGTAIKMHVDFIGQRFEEVKAACYEIRKQL